MDINSTLLADHWLWAHFIYWPILLLALYRAPWHILRQTESSHAFFAAAIAIVASGYTSYRILSAIENPLSPEILDQYLLLFVPLMYPEAFLTGGAVSILVVYKPGWIATFDDRRYLNDK